jgi:hypothetical protein
MAIEKLFGGAASGSQTTLVKIFFATLPKSGLANRFALIIPTGDVIVSAGNQNP